MSPNRQYCVPESDPKRWLRLTAGILAVDSWRPQRLIDDDTPARAIESQLQLAARISF